MGWCIYKQGHITKCVGACLRMLVKIYKDAHNALLIYGFVL